MRVWVVMGNDYPEAVFSSEQAAEEFCKQQRLQTEHARIYWRHYDFIVNNV